MAEIDESTQAEITQAFAAFSEAWQRNVVAPIRQALASIEKLIQVCGIQPSFRRRRPRNTRVQKVQAKRKALDLSQDGKCCGLRTRKASYALRQAEERWYQDMTTKQPHRRDFEHIPMRRRRKQAIHDRQFARELRRMSEARFVEWMDEQSAGLARMLGISAHEIAQMFAISAQELGNIDDYNR